MYTTYTSPIICPYLLIWQYYIIKWKRKEKKNKYWLRGKKQFITGIVEELNEEEDEEDQQRIEKNSNYLEGLKDENQDMGNLRDPYDE